MSQDRSPGALLNVRVLDQAVVEDVSDRLMELMMHDKKVEYGKMRFILPDRLGNVELVSDVDPDGASVDPDPRRGAPGAVQA